MSIMSENLKKARKAISGLSQDQAAELLGVKRPTLGAWEEGRCRPPLAKFPKIIEVYGITDLSGFVLNENFDPKKQSTARSTSASIIEERYKKLPKKLKKVVDELLKCY